MKEKYLKICSFLADFSIFAIIFFVPIYFSVFYHTWNIFELPKFFIFKCFLSIGSLAWLAKIFISGFFEYRGRKIIFWLFLGLIISWFVSALLSIHPGISFYGNYYRLQGFVSFLFYILFFFLVFFNAQDFKKIKIFLWAAISSSFLVCFYGAAQFLYFDSLKWAEPFELSGRIFSTLGQPNFLGHYLIIILPITVYGCFFLANKFLAKFFFWLLVFLQLICLYYTLSRSACLGLIGEVWFFITIFLGFKARKKLFLAWLAVSGMIVIALFASTLILNNQKNISLIYQGRIVNSVNLSGGSVKMRLLFWSSAAKEFVSAPILRKFFGYGQDVLSDIFAKRYSQEWAVDEKLNMWPDRAHNFIFDSLLSVGFLGFIISLSLFFYFIKKIYLFLENRQFDQKYWLMVALCLSFFGYFVNNFFSFSAITHYIYFYFFLALTAIIFYSSEELKKVKISLSLFSKVLIFSFLFIFLAIFIFYQGLMSLKADSYIFYANNLGNNDCQILQFNRLAIILNPQEIFYKQEYIHNALNCFSAYEKKEDKEALKKNIEITLKSISSREKYYYLKLEEAKALSLFAYQLDSSLKPAVEKIFLSLLKEYPNISRTYYYYADHQLKIKNYKGAEAVVSGIEKIIPKLTLPIDNWNIEHRRDIASEWVRFYNLSGAISESEGDLDGAIVYYVKLLKADPYQLSFYKKIADVYYQKKDFDNVLWYNKRGYSLNRFDYAWPFSLAIVLQEKGDLLGAERYANEALRLSPENKEIINFLDKLH